MNSVTLQAFQDELQKIAGVGWDLHGYHRKPENSKIKTQEDAWDAAHSTAVGDYPPFEVRHGPAKKYEQAKKDYRKKSDAFIAKNPIPKDMGSYVDESRIKTPFDRDTNYKLNSNMDLNSGASLSLDAYTTDKAYSEKETIRNLSKKDLKNVVKEYQSKLEQYQKAEPDDPWIRPGGEAFVNKAKHLLKDPKFRFARLEYE